MSITTDFITELVRAANEVGKLGSYPKRRLLDRAVTTIRDMRESVGIPPSRTTGDAVVDIQITAAMIDLGRATDEQVRASLLEAATIVRDLHIVLDAETEIQIEERHK